MMLFFTNFCNILAVKGSGDPTSLAISLMLGRFEFNDCVAIYMQDRIPYSHAFENILFFVQIYTL
jgi:hypothetical protein